MRSPIRTLFLPPAGRPRWVCPEGAQLDLLYLSWGRRRFGEYPIPVSLHPGWVYALVARGAPALRLQTSEVPTKPGDVLLIDPDCASGWISGVKEETELITWMWRSAPRCAEAAPRKAAYIHFQASAPLRNLWLQAHRACRHEVGSPDGLTRLAVEQLRLGLDVAVARARARRSPPLPAAVRLELALRWLAQNLSHPRPVVGLCEYLQISPVTLNRLFRAELKESVAEWRQRARVQFAIERIQENVPVKEVSYLLGYRHPNDLSRAIKKATGRTARTLGTRVKA